MCPLLDLSQLRRAWLLYLSIFADAVPSPGSGVAKRIVGGFSLFIESWCCR
jgi:hypothetical protein